MSFSILADRLYVEAIIHLTFDVSILEIVSALCADELRYYKTEICCFTLLFILIMAHIVSASVSATV